MSMKTVSYRGYSEMKKSMLTKSLSEFADMLSSREPVPGGGGASALCAALGASLGSMVVALSLGKGKSPEEEAALQSLSARAEKARDELLGLIDGDAEAFLPLATAYRLPKDAPGRAEERERCLKLAASAPLRILELCCEVIALQEELSRLGSPLMRSDVATGSVLAWGAMYGAAVNVLVNTKAMKDRPYAEELNRKVQTLMGEYWQRADRCYEDIFASLQ